MIITECILTDKELEDLEEMYRLGSCFHMEMCEACPCRSICRDADDVGSKSLAKQLLLAHEKGRKRNGN